MSTKRGALIVIEGLDRSGKSTQAATLLARLSSLSLPVKLQKFPGMVRLPPFLSRFALGLISTTAPSISSSPPTAGKPRMSPLSSFLAKIQTMTNASPTRSHPNLPPLLSPDASRRSSSLESTLLLGTTVLCDRYAFSGLAFSAAKGLSYAWCRAPDVGLPLPDLTLFLDVSPEIALARGGYGDERYEREALQRRVREQFARIGGETSGWTRVDADQDLDSVARDVWAHVEPLAHGVSSPIQKLWAEAL